MEVKVGEIHDNLTNINESCESNTRSIYKIGNIEIKMSSFIKVFNSNKDGESIEKKLCKLILVEDNVEKNVLMISLDEDIIRANIISDDDKYALYYGDILYEVAKHQRKEVLLTQFGEPKIFINGQDIWKLTSQIIKKEW